MRKVNKILLLQLLPLLLVVFMGSNCQRTQKNEKSILVFSKTVEYRHKSIEEGIRAMEKIASELNYEVVSTEDAAVFTEDSLSSFDVVVFLSTTGDILNPAQQQSFESFIRDGGGFLGIHAAADTEYEWPWYGKLVGGYFAGHPNNPNVREAVVRKTDLPHFITEQLPKVWKRKDEWYNYKSMNPDIRVLLQLDESTYEGGTMEGDHPIAWFHEYDGGRAFYTGLGHTGETYKEDLFLTLIKNAIQYAAGERQ